MRNLEEQVFHCKCQSSIFPYSNRSEREVRGAGLVLQIVWGFKELRRTLEKDGWKKTDFMVNLNPPNNTRSNGVYEDSTLPLIERGKMQHIPAECSVVFTQQTDVYRPHEHTGYICVSVI